MTRSPPSDVLKELRTEVGFGCPICRNPLLTWHHFDPPWRVEEHHNPKGMIALCRCHADAADANQYTKEYLRDLKGRKYADARVKLPWGTRPFIVRLGGNYVYGEKVVPLVVNNTPVISIDKDEQGYFLLSTSLQDKDGNQLIQIDENMMNINPEHIHDLRINTAPTEITVWFTEEQIGLKLSCRTINMEKLNSILKRDKLATDKKFANLIKDHPLKNYISSSTDMCGDHVRNYAKTILDSEGNLSFLDFNKMHVFFDNKEITIHNGIMT